MKSNEACFKYAETGLLNDIPPVLRLEEQRKIGNYFLGFGMEAFKWYLMAPRETSWPPNKDLIGRIWGLNG